MLIPGYERKIAEEFAWIEDRTEIDFLFALANSISKKHKRSFVISYLPIYNENIKTPSGDGKWENCVARFVENDTKFSKTKFFEDNNFRRKLQTNIKNHVPSSVYNYLVFRASESKKVPENLCFLDIHKKVITFTAYRVLKMLCETLYEDLYKQNPVFHEKSYPPEYHSKFGFYLRISPKNYEIYLDNKNYKSLVA